MGFDPVARGSADKALNQIGNLYSPEKAIAGYLVNSDGTLLANASYLTSDYISVESGKQILIPGGFRSLAQYDINKSNISAGYLNYVGPRDVIPMMVRLSTIAKYIRVSGQTSILSNPLYGVYKILNPSRWITKIWAAFGDSLTQQNMWQPFVNEVLGFSYQNFGVGGTRVSDGTGSDTTAMCRDERINAIPSNANLITFMGGTNDWAQNVVLGSLGSTDTTTFYGALNITFQKLITRLPTARIIAMTPPIQKMPSRAGWTDTVGYKNTLNLTTADYGAAIISAAKLYSIPVVDLYANSGWSDINISTYITNDGNYLHPNTEGGKRIASLVISAFRQTEPFE